MTRPVVAAGFLLLMLTGCSRGSASGSHAQAAACSPATATAVVRVRISPSGVDPACARVAKGSSFTLLNVDARRHSLTTTTGSPLRLQVDLKQGATFPYRFTKSGTYTFVESASRVVLTILVS